MFRDEDLAYALRPGQAGVPVEFHLHPGAPHEFDFIAFNTTAARRHRRPRSFEHRKYSAIWPATFESTADSGRYALGAPCLL
jgi:acetyl esterase/lipase